MALHLPVIFQVLIFLVLFGMAVTFMGTGYDNFIVGIAQLTGDGFLQDDDELSVHVVERVDQSENGDRIARERSIPVRTDLTAGD